MQELMYKGYLALAPSYCLWMSGWSAEFLIRDCSSLLGCQSFLEGATTPAGPQVVTIRLGRRALGLASTCLVTPRGAVPYSYHLFLGVKDPWGSLPCSGGEGSSPWVL
jgi:hypothetical protein